MTDGLIEGVCGSRASAAGAAATRLLRFSPLGREEREEGIDENSKTVLWT